MKGPVSLFSPLSVGVAHIRLLGTRTEDEDFVAHARACSALPHSTILLSGGPLNAGLDNRYSIAAWDPMLIFESKGSSCRVHGLERTVTVEGNPLDVLDGLISGFRIHVPYLLRPFSGGALGYFAYDLKNTLERLPQTARDDLGLPDIFLVWPMQILLHDRLRMELHYLGLCPRDTEGSAPQPSSCFAEPSFRITSRFAHFSSTQPRNEMRVGPLRSNFHHEDYLQAVRKVRHYIREGDVYQVNLSQRYEFSFQGDPFQLWSSLFQMNPAPFYAYVNAGDHQVLSTSMERFLYRQGNTIETRPIKGTRKRGATAQEDEALRRELQSDPKDDAELSMIVDLLRNDLGRVCSPRSIRVTEHKRLETYQNVHHLVSIVTGELKSGTTCGDLIRATFPGGSITGCPKIRSMEIIDELEPNVRHVYTGAIGYIGFHKNLDLNVAIRTALIHRGSCYFSVGGGIVYDSREEDEYQETLHKGRTLFQLIEKIGTMQA